MAEIPKVHPEARMRMLIDGELVAAASGKTFENVNPATEEVLGSVADADAGDMQRAIAAARRAFDTTDWSAARALHKRCLEQRQEALEAEREELREELILETGCPRIANDSAYGLSGAVFSGSLDRAMAVAGRVRTGSIHVNGGMAIGPDVPFGGYKASGIGRQNGVQGFDQYLEVKAMAWPAG